MAWDAPAGIQWEVAWDAPAGIQLEVAWDAPAGTRVAWDALAGTLALAVVLQRVEDKRREVVL